MEQEISSKEKLLRIIKHTPGKKKTKKVEKPILTVEDTDSPLVADNILNTSYKGTPSIRVRGAIRQIIRSDAN